MTTLERTIGAAVDRVDGRAKASGAAEYALDHAADDAAFAVAVQAPIASGTVRSVDASRALLVPGTLAVLSHENAPALPPSGDAELRLFQAPEIVYHGQVLAGVAAESIEAAAEAAQLVRFDIQRREHDVVLRPAHDRSYAPGGAGHGGMYPSETNVGDFDDAFARAAVRLDETYSTPAQHHNPMEPHSTLAMWSGEELTLYESTQGAHLTQAAVAEVLGLNPAAVRVVAQHVGGGFGSKVVGPGTILAALLAKMVGRPVKLAMTRQQMFAVTGYRTPTLSRVRLAAEADGRLVAIGHDALSQSSRWTEFIEPTAVATRVMYAAPNRRTTHRVARLDVPTPTSMRAPGVAPGMFALESAVDELAVRLDVDPIELRIRNEPSQHPEGGGRWSSRHLVECLREGATRFGWSERAPSRDGDWLVGTGVASAMFPSHLRPSRAVIERDGDGTYTVRIDATDVGTGARTALTQIAADALDAPIEDVRIEIGDTRLPAAWAAGGSAGTASWGTAIALAAEELRRSGEERATGDTATFVTTRPRRGYYAFGAQFAEVRVSTVTGEVRVPRALGVFAAGRIVNPKTARSQLIGGITWGISMALHEESVMDAEFGAYLNHDLAGYHLASHADLVDVEGIWIDEDDPHVNPLGVKGIGEIGCVGVAAAIANAVHHATGIRVRDLPIRLDRLIGGLPGP